MQKLRRQHAHNDNNKQANMKNSTQNLPVGCFNRTSTKAGRSWWPLILPEIYSSRIACIYSTDGKCQGMMTLEGLIDGHPSYSFPYSQA